MLGNGILETTTGATTGDLTVTGVTGRPRFSDEFTANATEALADPFYYSILTRDTIPILVEQGIGWLSSTGTLKRATIIATYSSGVPTYGGTAFSLTSGSTYDVICTPEMGSLLMGIPDIASLSGSNHLRAFAATHLHIPISSGATVKDRLVYTPVRFDSPRRMVSVRANNGGTAGTSGTRGFRIGLYSMLRNGLPGRLLQESGNITPSAFGAITYTFSAVRYAPGWYYVGLVHDFAGTLPTIYANTNLGSGGYHMTPLGLQGATGDKIQGCYEALTAGWTAMPANANATQTLIVPGGGVYAHYAVIGVE